MSASDLLQGACVWRGAEMVEHRRWVREFPPDVLDRIDGAAREVAALDWRQVGRDNFRLPDTEVFFDEVREELENGCGIVKLQGLDLSRYRTEQLRRIWFGLGAHLGWPLYQNCR